MKITAAVVRERKVKPFQFEEWTCRIPVRGK